ncbi:MAG: cadherin-like beta sandwich domain-containing protein [Bacilli bacterium]|nr:cadherin-like beta sandwich domain-containing protein [Bacilli bacterium]
MNNYLKRILIILILIIPFFCIKNVYAASSTIKLTTSNSNVSLNSIFTVNVTVSEEGGKLGSFEYSITHDSKYLLLISGEEYQKDVGEGDGKSKTYTLKYKAISNGQTIIKVNDSRVVDWDTEKDISVNNGSLTINIGSTTNTNTTESKSSDNSLKSLFVEGFNISPKFNKDTLEYNVNLSSDTLKIKIIAEKNDDTASITGDGEVDVKEGNNTINVVVTAENGATRTYKINAYVQEQAPITVKIKGKKYTVLKKLIGINLPSGFKEKTIKINDTEVDAFYNDKLNFTIVGLKDSIGNISLYLYDETLNKYTKYSPIVSDGLSIIILNAPENKIPHRYYKTKFSYNGDLVTGYTLSEKSDFRVVYGINTETGSKGLYLYDIKENTIQRFYNDQVNIYVELIQKIKYAFIILGSFILLLTLIIISLLSKNIKFKKKYIEKRLSKIDNPIYTDDIKYQDLEGTTTLKKVEKYKNKDKPTKKRKREKTFLDE